MERDFNPGFNPNFADYNMQGNMGVNMGMEDQFFNPIMQYEQATAYYRYLCMQMDYKIKCKEYERMCGNNAVNDTRRDRRVE